MNNFSGNKNQQPQARSSIASQILAATPSGARYPFISDGRYVFEVLKVEHKERSNTVAIELMVLEAEPINDLAKPNPVGHPVSYLNGFNKTDSAAGNVLSFFMALTNTSNKSDPTFGETLDEAMGPGQIAKGMKIRGSTFRCVTKKGNNIGKEIVLVNWSHYTEPTGGSSESSKKPAF